MQQEHCKRALTAACAISLREESGIRLLLRQTEQCFLRRNYRQALSLCNQYFARKLQEGIEESSSEKALYLFPLISIQELPGSSSPRRWSILETNEPSTIHVNDQLASIALQSWQELFLRDKKSSYSSDAWGHLKPVVDWYSKKPMPMEVFVGLWITFWESHGYRSEVLEWTLQVLRKGYAEDIIDELWIHCLSDQIPRVQDVNVARNLAQGLFFSPQNCTNARAMVESSPPSSPRSLNSVQNDELQTPSIEALLRVLDKLPSTLRSRAVVESERRLKQQLSKQQDQHDDSKSARIDLVPESLTKSQVFDVPERPASKEPASRLIAWAAWMRRRLQRAVSDWVKTPQFKQRRGTVAVSIFFALAAWRQKILLMKCTRVVVTALLSPITELIEALMITSDSERKRNNNGKKTSNTRALFDHTRIRKINQ